jgi:hypothetical protein
VLAGCSDAGTCDNGVCVCEHGSYGVGCELRTGAAQQQNTRSPSIYVYDLPPAFNVWHSHGGPHGDVRQGSRNTGWLLWQALLVSPHRTLDGRNADYFFVPVFPMGGQPPDELLLRALQLVIHTFPFWNATTGHNHLAVGGDDFGLCGVAATSLFTRIRQLSHFGLSNMTGQRLCSSSRRSGPSYRPGVDVVMPDAMELDIKRRRQPLQSQPGGNRSTVVFFAGRPTNAHRSRVFELFSSQPGWRIVRGHVDLAQAMGSSVFCLDLGGAGFSTRFALAVIHGCIPIYLTVLAQPWSDVLELQHFSYGIAEAELDRLPQSVAELGSRTAAMQRALRRHWQAFHWKEFFGPLAGWADEAGDDAFATLMKRLDELHRLS